ncbi:probable CDP-diacylglycerol-glycerol-3-phosphate 3-phosphatidyltransferase [Coccomyxa sp. Obi]|nr:probable CDP-diacylglycerol-glycerol-3-phosphate 3-phosphatidyltransferase [Coccomyxa sp. Obi]
MLGLRTTGACCKTQFSRFTETTTWSGHGIEAPNSCRSSAHVASKLLKLLAGKAHQVPHHGADIDVLSSPAEFHESLLDRIKRAKENVTIASLYAGTSGGLESQFVDALQYAATKTAHERPGITILLDALRSTRPSFGPQGEETSTAEMLDKALLSDQNVETDVSIHLFHTPALRGVLKRLLPPRVSEVVGVSHLKCYMFDDDIMISGANISNTYFSNRQDRYFVVRNARLLANHIRSLVQVVGRYSYRLQPGARLAPNLARLDPLTAPSAFNRGLRQELEALFVPGKGPRGPSALDSASSMTASTAGASDKEAAASSWEAAPTHGTASSDVSRDMPATALSDRITSSLDLLHRHTIGNAVPDLRSIYKRMPSLGGTDHSTADPSKETDPPFPNASDERQGECSTSGREVDTWIIPMVQLGSAGLRQDEALTTLFLRAAEPGSSLAVSTAYLNLTRSYEAILAAKPQVHLRLLTASPAANGFYGAKGVSGMIPTAYSLLEQHTWRRLQRAWARGGGATTAQRSLLEYNRAGWEFHAKGIWYTPPGEALPIATAVGSPNYGYRSVVRDLEAQFLIITTNPALRQAMADELEALCAHAEVVTNAHFLRADRRGTPTVRLAAHLLRGFL